MLDFLKEIVEPIPDPSAGGTIDLDSEEALANSEKKRRNTTKGKAAVKAAAAAEGGEPAPKKRRKKKADVDAAAVGEEPMQFSAGGPSVKPETSTEDEDWQ